MSQGDYLFDGYNADPNDDPRLKALYDEYYGRSDDSDSGYGNPYSVLGEEEPELSQNNIDYLASWGYTYDPSTGLCYDEEGNQYEPWELLDSMSYDDAWNFLEEQGFEFNPDDGLWYDKDGSFYYEDDLLAILNYQEVCQIDYPNLFDVWGGGEGYMKPDKDFGKEPPAHSISRPVDIKTQEGPRCSAYSSSCLLRYNGIESKPKKLYEKFAKLPDGSALPSSVGRHIGAKLCKKGTIEDLEKIIDSDQPALVLCYYNKTAGWNNLHYILITGYDDDNLYIADSLHMGGERYYNRVVSKEMFRTMWDTSETIPIKVLYGNNIYYKFGR